MGTPKEIFGTDGECLWQAEHELWGRTTVKAQKTRPGSHLPLVDCSLRFQNQWEDEETGLFYNLNRYYDPDSGQYLSTDPIGLEGGLRSHGYVHDPMQWVDPLGLAPVCPKYFRYVSKGEAKVIKTTGKIPNVDKYGNPKKIYFTNRYYKTAGKAKTHCQLENKPVYRVEIDPNDVTSHSKFSKVKPTDNPNWSSLKKYNITYLLI